MKNRKSLAIIMFIPFLLSSCGGFSAESSAESSSEDNSSSEISSSGSEEIDNKIQVIICMGQSNMEGFTHSEYLAKTMPEKADEFATGYPDIRISYKGSNEIATSKGEYVSVALGQGTGTDRFGPEVGMAEIFHSTKTKHPICLIKYAYGGTSLHGPWQSPSSGFTGGLYKSALEYSLGAIKKLEDMDYYPEIEAFCWMQGEDDSSGQYYDQYYKLEKYLVQDLRKDYAYYGNPNGIAFIDAGISDCAAWTNQKIVNDAKKQLAAEDALHFFFSTIDEGLKYNGEPAGSPDIYHFDSSSMIKLGNLFAQTILKNKICV